MTQHRFSRPELDSVEYIHRLRPPAIEAADERPRDPYDSREHLQ